ncbi:MAG: NADH-quinone oxidoreductase subunit NuoF [bacterium]|jgi:bidirectional [NiFe] hydrogenase diaphorase subunit|nr:NADH-quinone oxidoreductase subunit NuoF [bacterium]
MTTEELLHLAQEEKENQEKHECCIRVCTAAGCLSAQSNLILDALKEEVKKQGLEEKCLVKSVGCMGPCCAGPVVYIEPDRVMYAQVQPSDVPEIVQSLGKTPVERLNYSMQTPFFTSQRKIVLENCGLIDPENIHDYILADGYGALLHVLTQSSPPEVIDEVVRSGLRGRGGAGYPTGLKWSTVAKAHEEKKYVVCNADEGDPGAFMDRSILESDPHRVLEGMTIAAYAAGASHGFVYVRAEYPLAIKRLQIAIKQAERNGFLGNKICGTPFNFDIEVRLGAGAFVCGEETALIASIEGKRGMPRPRPPYPAQEGVWGYPTLINNVETYANVAPIIRNGADWFTEIGTEKSKGTKVFALAGRVQNTGLIEVEMGTSLRKIVYDIGGGIPGEAEYKAVQTGGPSGGCIPKEHLDTPVDYESLTQLGSIMGSGGMIVMDGRSCMVDVAKFFMDFCVSESCGKCVPCRVGTAQMYDLLHKITCGKATTDDLDLLETLCDLVKNTSLCGLGQTAPNPVISTLRYFRGEYENHINSRHCEAGVCKIKQAAEVKP